MEKLREHGYTISEVDELRLHYQGEIRKLYDQEKALRKEVKYANNLVIELENMAERAHTVVLEREEKEQEQKELETKQKEEIQDKQPR